MRLAGFRLVLLRWLLFVVCRTLDDIIPSLFSSDLAVGQVVRLGKVTVRCHGIRES